MRSTLFAGFILSLLVISFVVSNFSRRKIFLISTGLGLIGCIVLVLSQSILTACFGLFLLGFNGLGVTQLSYAIVS